jgi:hypothetical protein
MLNYDEKLITKFLHDGVNLKIFEAYKLVQITMQPFALIPCIVDCRFPLHDILAGKYETKL